MKSVKKENIGKAVDEAIVEETENVENAEVEDAKVETSTFKVEESNASKSTFNVDGANANSAVGFKCRDVNVGHLDAFKGAYIETAHALELLQYCIDNNIYVSNINGEVVEKMDKVLVIFDNLNISVPTQDATINEDVVNESMAKLILFVEKMGIFIGIINLYIEMLPYGCPSKIVYKTWLPVIDNLDIDEEAKKGFKDGLDVIGDAASNLKNASKEEIVEYNNKSDEELYKTFLEWINIGIRGRVHDASSEANVKSPNIDEAEEAIAAATAKVEEAKKVSNEETFEVTVKPVSSGSSSSSSSWSGTEIALGIIGIGLLGFGAYKAYDYLSSDDTIVVDDFGGSGLFDYGTDLSQTDL